MCIISVFFYLSSIFLNFHILFCDALTPYEFSIAMLAAKGRSNKEIAALMGVSVNTVKSYMESIFEKLQISSRNEIDAYVNR